MNWLLPLLVAALGGYVCGATPFGYLAGKWKGIDIRQHGSGNIGATNVIRVCGKGIGIPVFLLDVLKGWLPAWLAQGWFAARPSGTEAIYKIYAESFRDENHLRSLIAEANKMVDSALAS